jgi:phage regulator Rha-like protein
MNELSTVTKPTMSSLEIAKLTDKRHDNVLADIRRILEEAEISPTGFLGVYKDQQLIDRPCFYLPERETHLIISGYSVPHRLKIIDRWQELESTIKVPTIHDPRTLALIETLTRFDAIEHEQKSQALKIEAIEARQEAIINGSDYFAVTAYANLHKVKMPDSLASTIGKDASKPCRANGISMGSVNHPKWGSVYTYPEYVLELSFAKFNMSK